MRTRTALLACLLGLAPALALGQTITVSLSQGADQVINIAECNDAAMTFSLTSWTLSGTGVLGTDTWYRVFATSATSCPTAVDPSGSNVNRLRDYTATNGNLSGTGPTAVNLRATLTAIGYSTCPVGNSRDPVRLCIQTYDSARGTLLTFQASQTIGFDLIRPGTPAGVGASPGDGALNVTWAEPTSGTTPTSWTATANGVASGTSCTSALGSSGSCTASGSSARGCRISGIANDGCYQVVVTGTSDSGNDSEASAAVPGVPRAAEDFWERYGSITGHREQGGCGGGPASTLSLLALLALAPRLLRRRP